MLLGLQNSPSEKISSAIEGVKQISTEIVHQDMFTNPNFNFERVEEVLDSSEPRRFSSSPPFVQFLYAIMTIPSILVSFLNTPLYKMILGDDNINFGPVSLYLGVFSALTWACTVYLWLDSRKLIKEKEEEEKNSLYSPEKTLIDTNRTDEIVKA